VRVVELTAHHVRIPLKKPIRHASHVRSETDNVVVSCRLEDGVVGWGEGVPREYVTGESIDFALDLLRRSDLGSQLASFRDLAEALRNAENLRLEPTRGDDRACRGNAARCAVELAYLDAVTRRFGVPLAEATKLLAPDLYEPRSQVRYSGAITSTDGWFKVRVTAFKLYVYGFRHVKVKVGIAGQDDVKRLKHMRARFGWRMDVRIDANEAWSATEAAEKIQALEPFRISSVEQPIHHGEAASFVELRRQVKTPIMLDESLCGMIDAERAVAGGWCDLFNIRLSKCGGFVPSLRLVQFARQHGLGCQLGCQVGETAILSAAGRHFASSVAGLRWLEGSYDRHLVREALGTRDLTFGWGGIAPALTGPGLGVEVDSTALQRVTVRKVPLLGPR
jgi:muconate cycloisomerase